MVYATTLSDEEYGLLISYYKRGPNTLVRARAHAIILSAQNIRTPQIAQMLLYNKHTVGTWIKHWNSERMASLFPKYQGNENAAKLTRAQKKEIENVLGNPPSDKGLPGTFWTLPGLKQYVNTVFGVVYESTKSYYFLLKHCGYSFKLPSPFDRRRDERLIEARMKEIRKEIKPFLKNPDWEVLVQDECHINWEEETRRAWIKRGEKTIVKLERDKGQSQSYFGALNQKTGTHHLIELSWQDSANTIAALQLLSKEYPGKKLCIVWDNAKWHKSQELREHLKKGQSLEHIHLINFPPYAPDENPQEHVWKEGKQMIANTNFESFTALKDAFCSAVTGRTFNYRVLDGSM
jgi:transposase